MAAAGASRSTMRQGSGFLRRSQDRDGGFALGGGSLSNAQSSAWAAQGLVAAGVSPSRIREHGHSPLDYLAKRQRGDGHYEYSASSDQTPVWVTGQALAAVRREAFPVRPVARPVRHRSSSGRGRGGGSGGSAKTSSPTGTGTAPTETAPSSGGGDHSGGSKPHPHRAPGGGSQQAPDGSDHA